MSSLRIAAAAAALLVSTLATANARADEALPPSQPPPASARAPNGEYVAPMQQQTQAVYVPQSVALSGPRIIRDYEDGEPVPHGYHAETRVRTGLVVGGAVTFGVMYLFSVLAGSIVNDANKYSSDHTRGDFLFVPVVGPFLQMTNTSSSSGTTMLAIDGLAQAAGATMLIVGVMSPRTVLVRNDLAEVRVTPMQVGEKGSGVGLVGTF
ncbi:MAG TPA: hypothetical protein VLT33_34710 [Labilithrix sp.]|nr:hypothetical protein [Labilithrix sp.]